MAYKKLKIICDADDVLISCNAYPEMFQHIRCHLTETFQNQLQTPTP